MNKIINYLRSVLNSIPGYSKVPLIMVLIYNFMVYFGSRIFTTSLYHHEIGSALDQRIPLIPWTVLIYAFSYIFWVKNYILAGKRDKEFAYRFCCGEMIMKTLCLFFYIFYPTTTIRPEIVGNGIWNHLMRFLYTIDPADNLFPSLHCSASLFSVFAVYKNNEVPASYRYFSYLLTIMIFISTLTTRQHVIIDGFGGIAVAFTGYYLAKFPSILNIYRRMIEQIEKILNKTKL